MFIVVESYQSYDGAFNTNIGHTTDEEISKNNVEKLNKDNEKIQKEISFFLANTLTQWEKENPRPVETKKNRGNYQTQVAEWLNLRTQFISKNCPQTKYDSKTSWSYEPSSPILLEHISS